MHGLRPVPRDAGERRRASFFQVAARVVSLAALAGPGCRDEVWVGAPQAGPPSAPRPVRPAIGPWFVDRARDFGLDVVTRCGSPEKRSVLDSIGTGVALFDCDGDGDLDLFVAAGSAVRDGAVTSAGGPWLFRNDGPGRWVDVSARSGLVHTGWAQGAAVADYDADGDLDLFLAQHGPDTLWQNRGDGTFRDVTAAAGLADSEWGVSAAWGDADGDGWPDLYVTNYLSVDPLHPPDPIRYYGGEIEVFRGPERLSGEPDRLWRNRGDGTFEDVTEGAGLLSPIRQGDGGGLHRPRRGRRRRPVRDQRYPGQRAVPGARRRAVPRGRPRGRARRQRRGQTRGEHGDRRRRHRR